MGIEIMMINDVYVDLVVYFTIVHQCNLFQLWLSLYGTPSIDLCLSGTPSIMALYVWDTLHYYSISIEPSFSDCTGHSILLWQDYFHVQLSDDKQARHFLERMPSFRTAGP